MSCNPRGHIDSHAGRRGGGCEEGGGRGSGEEEAAWAEGERGRVENGGAGRGGTGVRGNVRSEAKVKREGGSRRGRSGREEEGY